MTRSLSIPRATAPARGAGHVGRLWARFTAAVGAWARRRHNRAVLAELSDQQLADIGLARSDVGYRPLDGGPLGWQELGRRL